jgi:hypothetical protein
MRVQYKEKATPTGRIMSSKEGIFELIQRA